jgi:hypothetical protein
VLTSNEPPLAALEPPSPEMWDLFEVLQGNETETGRFVGTIAGTSPILDYYAPENGDRIVGRIAMGTYRSHYSRKLQFWTASCKRLAKVRVCEGVPQSRLLM